MYYVYVIYSEKLNRIYTGTTDDLDKRIEQHNSAFYPNSFTSKGIPWQLKGSFSFENNLHAYFAESFIKRMKSKIFIEKIIKDPELFYEIIDKNVRVQLRSFGAASSTKP
jgi:putative endonuclease